MRLRKWASLPRQQTPSFYHAINHGRDINFDNDDGAEAIIHTLQSLGKASKARLGGKRRENIWNVDTREPMDMTTISKLGDYAALLANTAALAPVGPSDALARFVTNLTNKARLAQAVLGTAGQRSRSVSEYDNAAAYDRCKIHIAAFSNLTALNERA